MPSSSTKKLFVDKNETAADLLKRMITAREKNIVIVVPKDASLKKSLKNFHFLKQETAAAGKNIVIETVDDEVLAFAKASEIEASHSLFKESAHRISDILPRGGGRHQKSEDEGVGGGEEERKSDAPLPDALDRKAEQFFREENPDKAPQRYSSERRWISPRGAVIALGILIVGGGAVFAVNRTAKATIAVHFQKAPFAYDGTVTVSPQITVFSADKDQIPGELFTSQKNFTQFFPATGKTDVSTKAKGTITVWNAYSSAPQTLVATTRFETPDGIIFRLDKQITVPGAHVANGQITPSSIDAPVTADQAGAAGNVGAIPKLTVPGFKGSPRYDGFYGQFKTGTSGGASGAHAVATADDIAQAKTKAQDVLTQDLETLVMASIPDGFTVLSSTANIAVSKISVNDQTDANGKFSVFAEATLQTIGFRESDLKSLLLAHANQNAPYREDFADLAMSFGNAAADYAHGMLTFHLTASGDVMPAFSSSTFISNIAGKSEAEARAAVLALPGLLDAKISLWPIWETKIPGNASRVTVQIN